LVFGGRLVSVMRNWRASRGVPKGPPLWPEEYRSLLWSVARKDLRDLVFSLVLIVGPVLYGPTSRRWGDSLWFLVVSGVAGAAAFAAVAVLTLRDVFAGSNHPPVTRWDPSRREHDRHS